MPRSDTYHHNEGTLLWNILGIDGSKCIPIDCDSATTRLQAAQVRIEATSTAQCRPPPAHHTRTTQVERHIGAVRISYDFLILALTAPIGDTNICENSFLAPSGNAAKWRSGDSLRLRASSCHNRKGTFTTLYERYSFVCYPIIPIRYDSDATHRHLSSRSRDISHALHLSWWLPGHP